MRKLLYACWLGSSTEETTAFLILLELAEAPVLREGARSGKREKNFLEKKAVRIGKPQRQKPPSAKDAPDLTRRRILVVDDEPLVCESVKRLLAIDGHKVTTTATGESALALFGKSRFDLVLVDYELPLMSGIELAAAIKARAPHQPIAMLTAYAEELQSGGARVRGVDLVMSKPFRLRELRRALKKLLPR